MPTCYPISKPVRSADPSFEPVSPAEAKQRLGISESIGTYEVELSGFIKAARAQVERDAMLVCATGTFTAKQTVWSDTTYFELPSSLRPVTSITSIVYVATDGTSTTWSSSQYALDTSPAIPVVKLAYGYNWPALRGDINGITVTAVAGYATAVAVPELIKQAILVKVSEYWNTKLDMHREAELAVTCYERIISQLRPEVYA